MGKTAMSPQTYLTPKAASVRLSIWMRRVPLVVFAEWRVDALNEIILILSRQTLNRSKGGQNIHSKVKKALLKGGQGKPTRNEFRAFWLNWGGPLKDEWLELLHTHSWDDLMDWSMDGPFMGDVSHGGNYRLMATAELVAESSQLSPLQAEFRGHLLAMRVRDVQPGYMDIVYPYALDTDFETLAKSIEAYTPAPEPFEDDAMSLDGPDEDSSEHGDNASWSSTTINAVAPAPNGVASRRASVAPGTLGNIGAPGTLKNMGPLGTLGKVGAPVTPGNIGAPITTAISTTSIGSGPGTTSRVETRPMINRPRSPREPSPDTETRINTALASLGRQMKQFKRKHSEDMEAMSRKHEEDIAALNRKHGDDMANVKQDIDELRAENARLRGGERADKRPAKAQLKDTVNAILEQELE